MLDCLDSPLVGADHTKRTLDHKPSGDLFQPIRDAQPQIFAPQVRIDRFSILYTTLAYSGPSLVAHLPGKRTFVIVVVQGPKVSRWSTDRLHSQMLDRYTPDFCR